jgi:ABC-2 type transport system ATP-binding protein
MAIPDVVRVEGVSKRFVLHPDKSVKERLVNLRRSKPHRQEFWALRDVDLTVAAGSTVGLIGRNGSGKSTLLKIIGGILAPTTGTAARRGRVAPLLELGAGFHPDLTGRENVYLNAAVLGMSQRETRAVFDRIVEYSGIEDFIDSAVKFYSSGMYVRLGFAVAVHVDPDLLLVDEVLAVGDEAFRRKCMDTIREFQREGRAILFVSHSAEQVRELCDRVVVLDHGTVIFDGDAEGGLAAMRSAEG